MNPKRLSAALTAEDIDEMFFRASVRRQVRQAPRQMSGPPQSMQAAPSSNGAVGIVDFNTNVQIPATQLALERQNAPQNASLLLRMGNATVAGSSHMSTGQMGFPRQNTNEDILAGIRREYLASVRNSQMRTAPMGQQGLARSNNQLNLEFDTGSQESNDGTNFQTPTGQTGFARQNIPSGMMKGSLNLNSISQVPVGQSKRMQQHTSSEILMGNSNIGSSLQRPPERTGFRRQNTPQNNPSDMRMGNRSIGSMPQTYTEEARFMRQNNNADVRRSDSVLSRNILMSAGQLHLPQQSTPQNISSDMRRSNSNLGMNSQMTAGQAGFIRQNNLQDSPPAVGMRNPNLANRSQTPAGQTGSGRQRTRQNGPSSVRMENPSLNVSPYTQTRQSDFLRQIAPRINPLDGSIGGAIVVSSSQVLASRPISAQASTTPQATTPNMRMGNSSMTGDSQSPPDQTTSPGPSTPNILPRDMQRISQPAARAIAPGQMGFSPLSTPIASPNVEMGIGLSLLARTVPPDVYRTQNRRSNPLSQGLQRQEQPQLRRQPNLFNLNHLQAHPWAAARALLPGPDTIYPPRSNLKPAPPTTIHDFEEMIRRHGLVHSTLSSIRLSNSDGTNTTPLDVENGIMVKKQQFELSLVQRRPQLEERERLEREVEARNRPLMFRDFVRALGFEEERLRKEARMRAEGRLSGLESEAEAEESEPMKIDETEVEAMEVGEKEAETQVGEGEFEFVDLTGSE